jgi:hypothetical protein
MIRTMAVILFGLALASSAQAMPLSSIQQPDKLVTKAAEGCGEGMYRVRGVCVPRCGAGMRWVGGRCIR